MLSDEQALTLLNEAEQNNVWFDRNFANLLKQYPDEFIAISNQAIVDVDKKIDGLLEKVSKKGFDTSRVAVKFVSKIKMIL